MGLGLAFVSIPAALGKRALTVETSCSSRQRIAVEWRYLRQCKVKEIAAALGKSEGAVAQLLGRAMETLRDILREAKVPKTAAS